MKVGDKVWFLADERDELTGAIDIGNIEVRCEKITHFWESNSTLLVTNLDESIYANEVYACRGELIEHLLNHINDLTKDYLIRKLSQKLLEQPILHFESDLSADDKKDI